MTRRSLVVDVGLGALVTVVLSFIPFSPIVGGAAVASRRDGGYLGGLAVGLAAGVAAAVPLAAFFVPALSIAGALGFGVAPSAPAYDVFLALVGLFFLLYTVGLSGLGGLAGVWVRRNTDWELDPRRWL